MRLDPTEELVLQVSAEAQLACGKTADAEATSSRLIELFPASASGFELRGRAEIGDKRFADAEASFREALRLEPDDWTLNNNLGVALQRQKKKKKEAIQAFERAAKANPAAKVPQQNLFGAANSYVGVGSGFFAIYLLLRLIPAIGVTTHLSTGLIFAIVGVAIVALFAVFWFRRRRRRQQLGPTVDRFYQHERLRYRNLHRMYLAFRLGPPLAFAVGLLALAIAQAHPGDFSIVFLGGAVAMTAWFWVSPFVWRRSLLPRLLPDD
jgi:tetratricopeptide (TPR) repeat protein